MKNDYERKRSNILITMVKPINNFNNIIKVLIYLISFILDLQWKYLLVDHHLKKFKFLYHLVL